MANNNLTPEQKKQRNDALLDNLLDIKGIDQAIYTRINQTSNAFDTYKLFGGEFISTVTKLEYSKVRIVEDDVQSLKDKINSFSTVLDIIKFLKEKNVPVTKAIVEKAKDNKLREVKTLLAKVLDERMENRTIKWKLQLRHIMDSNIEDNVWPLHIGTCFISCKILTKEVFAPLLLKEAFLEIEENDIYLISEGDWKWNEKLLFLLESVGFKGFDNIDLKEKEIHQIIPIIEQIIGIKVGEMNAPIPSVPKVSITWTTPKAENGTVLGLFRPSGGKLRKVMEQIIKTGDFDTLFDPLLTDEQYEKNIDDYFMTNSKNILHIQSTNFAQDKAIASSLIQNTIIWGPPGTGKSQVIANIIANILYMNKTAVVMSEKKVALDVLKKRMGPIAKYCFFAIDDNNMVKSEFYGPLKFFVNAIENRFEEIRHNPIELITKEELSIIEDITQAKEKGVLNSALKILNNMFKDNSIEETINQIKLLYQIDAKYTGFNFYNSNFNDYLDRLAVFNAPLIKIKKIDKVKKLIEPSARIAHNLILTYHKIDIDTLIQIAQRTPLDLLQTLLNSTEKLRHNYPTLSNERFLNSYLAKNVLVKVKKWKEGNPERQEELEKFIAAIKRGFRIPEKFIKDHKAIIKDLFPVVVATPDTLFYEWKKDAFDYVLLDESSQIFLETGIPCLYLGKIKILAGDPQQMKPTRWFSTKETEVAYSEGAESILEFALSTGVYKVLLDKNYRSNHAALMTFSSKHFYDSELDVIDVENIKSTPIDVIQVEGKWENSVNKVEALEVIKQLKENVNKYDHIIILAFNTSQKEYVNELIYKQNDPELVEALDTNKVLLKNIENIQGDEADLIIATIGYDFSTHLSSTYVARKGGKNALNVALSRGKDKLIVVKTIRHIDIKIKDNSSEDLVLFSEWLRFLDLSARHQRGYAGFGSKYINVGLVGPNEELPLESQIFEFIKHSIRKIVAMKVMANHEIGTRKIDIALFLNNKFILGFDIDRYEWEYNEGYHIYLDKLSKNEYLKSKGYEMFNIREADWKINKLKVLKSIEKKLTEIVNREFSHDKN